MPHSERIEFRTRDGVVLRGDFFPAAGRGRPVVVMAGGFGLLKELLTPFAAAFQEAGLSALTYDHRSFGSSDGLPRQEVDIERQAADFFDAVTAAARLPGVDAGKLVLWGIGHGASAAMIAAGRDPRLAASILCIPFPSGTLDRENIPPHQLEAALRERESRAVAETPPTMAKAFRDWAEDGDGDDATVFVRGPAGYGLAKTNADLAAAVGTPWRNEVTLESFLNIAQMEAQDHAYRIRGRVLYIVNEGDTLAAPAAVHRLIAARIGGAEFNVVPRQPGGELTDQLTESARRQVAWLRTVLAQDEGEAR